MSRRAVLRAGGLAALPLPLAGWRAPRARAAPPPGVTVRVEQLAGGLGPEDCPASLAFRLRGEDGEELAWEDLVSRWRWGRRGERAGTVRQGLTRPALPGPVRDAGRQAAEAAR